jgi:trehalose 6-phosphate phosphatase
MSYELRPPVPHGKGLTVERAATAAGLGAVCFMGDDTSDVDGFDALRRLTEDGGVRTVAVGVRSDESPPELLERADVVVDGPEGALALLTDLARAFDTQS